MIYVAVHHVRPNAGGRVYSRGEIIHEAVPAESMKRLLAIGAVKQIGSADADNVDDEPETTAQDNEATDAPEETPADEEEMPADEEEAPPEIDVMDGIATGKGRKGKKSK